MIWLMMLAGGAGAVLRYLVDHWLRGATTRFPLGTLAVNLLGSFALGLLVGADPGPDWLLVAGTGLLGGFTTFSTHAVESVRLLIGNRRAGLALGNLIGTALGCLVLAGLGWWLAS